MDNKEIKLTTDEQAEMLELNHEYQTVLIDTGQLQMQRLQLTEKLEELNSTETQCKSAYAEIEKKELNFRNRLVKKYGEGELDAHTGVYIIAKKNNN
jgi:hypothetical protein